MDKIELKNLLFLARINAKEEEYPEIIEKLENTFELIDEMQELDLSDLKPLNNPLELSNVSREDKGNNRNNKKKFLDNSSESDEDYFNVPKIIE
ncbi:MAG: Asp-tRNA(Asn)/Glu-tRNA(Gln) amidotransferase subunit GatC [Gammaproteobacteria bacterium TMED112]|nr:MAG: Asp-tRNA(Asn)/Glu-tRNA(Gln) amidotransferase subunit GatC [Gammaproteobacteria bacterium TMED112]